MMEVEAGEIYNSNLTCATDAVHSLSKVLDDVHCTTFHCQDSSQLQQPIRDQYYTVSTNQRSVLYCVNQSEESIYLEDDILGTGPATELTCQLNTNHLNRATNQKRVLDMINQSEVNNEKI